MSAGWFGYPPLRECISEAREDTQPPRSLPRRPERDARGREADREVPAEDAEGRERPSLVAAARPARERDPRTGQAARACLQDARGATAEAQGRRHRGTDH